ncbi:hypothetical protein BLNAU_11148 [Blattamonas nauphoetae]|uniref:Uncharacterized protein n=1 Tax=Blattamonas nauphoetae TaxID=2049346 RepID=A0ABQ9XNC0_9EUKA|nr:hypothetical protein BLNAU_11148 [Blattamonas nauphoetae]
MFAIHFQTQDDLAIPSFCSVRQHLQPFQSTPPSHLRNSFSSGFIDTPRSFMTPTFDSQMPDELSITTPDTAQHSLLGDLTLTGSPSMLGIPHFSSLDSPHMFADGFLGAQQQDVPTASFGSSVSTPVRPTLSNTGFTPFGSAQISQSSINEMPRPRLFTIPPPTAGSHSPFIALNEDGEDHTSLRIPSLSLLNMPRVPAMHPSPTASHRRRWRQTGEGPHPESERSDCPEKSASDSEDPTEQ